MDSFFFECPDCRRTHDEPAHAGYSLHVRCLDCELDANYRAEVLAATVLRRAA